MKPNSFAQRAKRSMQKPKSGGGGGAPYFVNQYKPSIHMVDTIRLLAGNYQTPIVDQDTKDLMRDPTGQPMYENEPYVQFVEHFSGTKRKSTVCSAGPLGNFKGKGEPCLGCDWFWYEWRVRQATNNKTKPKTMSKRDMWAFSVLVQAPFHKVDDHNDDGTPRINPNTQKPYFKWLMCQGRGCEHCAAQREVKQGHVQHWPMGRDHFNTLIDYSNIISKHCAVCGTEDCIEELAYVCGYGDDCGDVVIDMTTTGLNNQQIEEMSTTAVQCPTCRRKTFLNCMFRCPVCEKGGRTGARATIFDVDFKVKRIQDTTGESDKTTLSVVGTSRPGPVNSLYGDELKRPLDLPKVYTPADMARQLGFFGEVPTEEVVRTPVT